ncbi:MAG: hypothetical protein WKF84_12620 [Pyrinomonadaceae bacterium]
MPLKDVPDGAICYIDATIFYYHIVNSPPLSEDCSDFLERVEQGSVHGMTSAVAVSEATHKVMLTEVVAQHGVDRKGLIARIKRHPELLDGLAEHKRVIETIRHLGLSVEPDYARHSGERRGAVLAAAPADERRANSRPDGEARGARVSH